METKFFFCKHCGNVVVNVVDSGVVPVCCGEEMVELIPNTTDGLVEKHLPVIERVDDCTVRVKVGSAPHPMLEKHYISFIYVETENGGQLRYLELDRMPEVEICSCKDKITAIYCYCNIHGLWRATVPADFCKSDKCCGDGYDAKSGSCGTEKSSCSTDKGKMETEKARKFFGGCCTVRCR